MCKSAFLVIVSEGDSGDTYVVVIVNAVWLSFVNNIRF